LTVAGKRTPPIAVLLEVLIGQFGLEAPPMQIEPHYISCGEAESRQAGEEEFVDHSIARHADRAARGLMGSDDQAGAMPFGCDRQLPAIEQVSADPAFSMGELLIGGQGEALLHQRQIQQVVVLRAYHPPNGCGNQIDHDGSIAIEPIKADEGLARLQTARGLVRNDHLQSPQQLPSVIPIARSPKACQPAMGMGLQEGGAGTHHLSALLSGVARCTDRKQTPLRQGQIRTLRQSTLSGALPGAIQIEDDPSVPLSIPQTASVFCGSRASERILQEHAAERFYTGFI
jgi:hypothetical protein